MRVLVVNFGSSTLKYKLFEMRTEKVLLDGHIEFSRGGPVPAARRMLRHIRGKFPLSTLSAVGHRVVHGGPKYGTSALITDETLEDIADYASFAPLHNPPAAHGIRLMQRLLPNADHVAVFDTGFHRDMPPKAYLYGLPYDLALKHGIRRYGFHGASHQYVAQRCAVLMGRPLRKIKLITCHIGSGTSIAAVSGGRSVDTSMGMSPLQGVIMGTRSGTIDPAIVEFLMEKEKLGYRAIIELLNKRSGLFGLSGLSGDIRVLESAAKSGHRQAQVALDVHAYQIKKFIGSYLMALNGADAIVFTAGVGENSARLRADVASSLAFAGVRLDPPANEKGTGERRISTDRSKIALWVIPTNEELMIARETVR
ncbi:MAG: hypothetical protein A3G34_06135 [Candidatus Lindowbacteria bacterium RIFCSPLOWO2_12_FULL_62_27]|nr:MAG: hypothetical protein A3G34_06135 [Candidatus Lindowbacteria bacterium RIFCSPLOWO2_12_FULL_62_27]OGH58753.1 MAG: hypothetical protein A3I06_09510 [Candidatus Lindowbacteria bacterium RIFCSPLOWO2_02_FULL_62_12]